MLKLGEAKQYCPKKCSVYLKLPYLGERSIKIANFLRNSVKKTFYSVTLRTVYSTKSILPASRKDVLPITQRSNLIYKYTCKRCECTYIGRTTQRLEDRISQHVPKIYRYVKKPQKEENQTAYNLRKKKPVSYLNFSIPSYVESAIGIHLLENPSCAQLYDDSDFCILSQSRSSYHLNVLEAIYINSVKPELCRQKRFVYYCKLFANTYSFDA